MHFGVIILGLMDTTSGVISGKIRRGKAFMPAFDVVSLIKNRNLLVHHNGSFKKNNYHEFLL